MVGALWHPSSVVRESVVGIPEAPLALKYDEQERQEALLQAVQIAVPPSVMCLPYPENLMPLWSTDGLERLLRSSGPFERVSMNMEGQGMLQCGVTSLTVALNVCNREGTEKFTIDFLQEELREALKPANTFFSTSLREIGDLARRFSESETVHACDSDCDLFRQRAAATLEARGCVIVNFERATLGYNSPFGGHCSPLAAYDPTSDEFLVMDVARKTWQPVWVPTDLLFDGMNTLDEPRGTEKHLASNVCKFDFIEPRSVSSENRCFRGFILIQPAVRVPVRQESLCFIPWQRCSMWALLQGYDNLAYSFDDG